MDILLIPAVIVISVYGAAAAVLTAGVRKWVKRTRPGLEARIWRAEPVKRLIPAVVAFVLMIPGGVTMWSVFGLVLPPDSDVWGVRVALSLFSGIFSGWAYKFWIDVWRGRHSAAGSSVADGSPAGAGSTPASGSVDESDVL